jgi:hypothetical protein
MLWLTRDIKTEMDYQRLWCIVMVIIYATIAANTMAWNQYYNPIVQEILRDTRDPDSVGLFHLVEMGWFSTAALVFFSVVVRPRLPYLVISSTTSWLMYTTCALYLRNPVAVGSIVMRSMVYFFCCAFNLYANYTLEQGERKAYFLSKDLERKLFFEKEKLQNLFMRTTELAHQLAQERESRLRNLAEQATNLFEVERAKPLWHIVEEDIKCIHTHKQFRKCKCGEISG